VLTAEQRRVLAADRAAHVLEHELVGVLRLDLDELDVVPALQPQPRPPAVPRIADRDRAVRADRLDLAALGEVEAGVEMCEQLTRERQRRGKADVDARRAR